MFWNLVQYAPHEDKNSIRSETLRQPVDPNGVGKASRHYTHGYVRPVFHFLKGRISVSAFSNIDRNRSGAGLVPSNGALPRCRVMIMLSTTARMKACGSFVTS